MTLPWIAISFCPHTKLKQEMEVNNHDIFSSMIVYLYLSLLMWRSDRPKYRPQITQLVKHLTRESMGTGSSTGLVHNYFSHPITFRAMPAPETDKLTPATERVCVKLFLEGFNHLRGRNVKVRLVRKPVPDSSVDS